MLEWIDKFDLTAAHVLAALYGMVVAIYASQATWQDHDSNRDCWIVRYGRKVMYPALALAFLWSLDFAHVKGWTPWPPNVAINIAMDLIITMRIIALRQRQKEIEARGWVRPLGLDGVVGD